MYFKKQQKPAHSGYSTLTCSPRDGGQGLLPLFHTPQFHFRETVFPRFYERPGNRLVSAGSTRDQQIIIVRTRNLPETDICKQIYGGAARRLFVPSLMNSFLYLEEAGVRGEGDAN